MAQKRAVRDLSPRYISPWEGWKTQPLVFPMIRGYLPGRFSRDRSERFPLFFNAGSRRCMRHFLLAFSSDDLALSHRDTVGFQLRSGNGAGLIYQSSHPSEFMSRKIPCVRLLCKVQRVNRSALNSIAAKLSLHRAASFDRCVCVQTLWTPAMSVTHSYVIERVKIHF